MNLRRWIVPDDDVYQAKARALWRERDDLQASFPDPDSETFCRWLAVNAPFEHPERFGEYAPPLPPEDLRVTGCGGADAHWHLYSGLQDFEVVADTLQTFTGQDVTELDSVLDFGSGCGRLLRWFDRAAPDTKLTGIDVRRASIEWSNANLRGDFVAGPFDPPTEFADDSFDLVVALSLFSHFTREANVAWLRELARVCRPDGVMILTTHGALSLALIANSPEHQEAFGLTEADARGVLRSLWQQGFHYHEVSRDWQAAIEVGENYGQAFLDERFAAREWGPHVDILGCIPARLFGFQDVFVVRPRDGRQPRDG